ACCEGISAAVEDIHGKPFSGVPVHLRDAHYKGAERLGHGKGYKYPHSFPGHFTPQDYLPEEFTDAHYYYPSENGREKAIGELLQRLKDIKNNK
ncbi:MAG: replication-associated recombination protein A, partial [Oscillospiraceae bacterium]|nr:replication-associated recombination protein A [Oscillospiraceae bacterium]